MEQVLKQVSRYPGTTVVAVTKTVGVTEIEQAYSAGFRHFGENRVQDALPKIEALTIPVDWHFIGRLQTNKVKKAVSAFSLIQSLDSIKLAQFIHNEAEKAGVPCRCLVQVNASGEHSKQGLSPDEVPAFLDQTADLKFIRVEGLMTMAPFELEAQATRPVFRAVKRLFDEVGKASWPHVTMRHLSMGMSNDYLVALEEGANMVRIGSAIFS